MAGKLKARKNAKRSKPKATPFVNTTGNIFGAGMLDVADHYLQEAAAAKLELRWVSAKEMKENHGQHRRRWVVYKFKSKPDYGTMDKERFAFDVDPEGIVRRGDMVLAARPIEWGDQHREMLAEKRDLYSRYADTKKQEFKDYVRENARGAIKVDMDDE